VPVLRYATAEYHRMTRDYGRACAELEQVLGAVQAGVHQIWPYAVASHLLVLLELGRHEQALALARVYTVDAERELEYVPDQLQLAAALARAYGNEPEAALPVDAQIARLQEAGIGGLYLGVAHEIRARIALRQQDMSTFGRHTELCGQLFLVHKNAALTAKYHRLLQEGRRYIGAVTERMAVTPDSVATYGGSRVELALAGCYSDDQRARLALTLLTRQSGASAGALFLLSDDGPVCVATVGDVPDTVNFMPRVSAYLEQQLAAEDGTLSESVSQEPEALEWHDELGRIWTTASICHHAGGELAITGVAVFALPASGKFVRPAMTLAAISRFYGDRGGATSMMLAAD
jgi:hypothetical protein